MLPQTVGADPERLARFQREAEVLAGWRSISPGSRGRYAVSPDGKRFLLVENAVQPEVRELRVVLNWTEELKQRVPTR